MEAKMKTGDTVKFKTPASPEEKKARFILVEETNMMGRVKIKLVCELPLPPIELVDEAEVELA
jgi:hypothetical protein